MELAWTFSYGLLMLALTTASSYGLTGLVFASSIGITVSFFGSLTRSTLFAFGLPIFYSDMVLAFMLSFFDVWPIIDCAFF
jgi:hypothetical protein